jgi:predicted nucleic acid-binding protein
MAKFILTDSCFWLGLVDPTDQHHRSALEWADFVDIEGAILLLPWPCLYESISTRLIRSRSRTLALEQLLKRPTIRLLDDLTYRDAALEAVFETARVGHSYALADSVIREMLKDIDLRIDYLLTFNPADFQDVCQARRIELMG